MYTGKKKQRQRALIVLTSKLQFVFPRGVGRYGCTSLIFLIPVNSDGFHSSWLPAQLRIRTWFGILQKRLDRISGNLTMRLCQFTPDFIEKNRISVYRIILFRSGQFWHAQLEQIKIWFKPFSLRIRILSLLMNLDPDPFETGYKKSHLLWTSNSFFIIWFENRLLSVPKFTANMYYFCLSIPQI